MMTIDADMSKHINRPVCIINKVCLRQVRRVININDLRIECAQQTWQSFCIFARPTTLHR